MSINESIRLALAVAMCALVHGCGTDRADKNQDMDNDMPDDDGGPGLFGEATWHGGVGALMMRECSGCHTGGASAAPFAITYEDAKKWAAPIKKATAERTMPPMPVNNDGSCHTFSNARWLEDDEIALIGKWVDDDMPLGDTEKALPGPTDNSVSFDDPDFEVTTPVYEPDPNIEDDYRCFPVDVTFTGAERVTSFQVVPGNLDVVHHVVVYGATQLAEIEKKDADAPGPGYPCFGSATFIDRPLLTWVPGTTITNMPEGTGLIMPAGNKLVVQVHYNQAMGPGMDMGTVIRGRVTDHVEHSLYVSGQIDIGLNLEPGQKQTTNQPKVDPSLYFGIYDIPLTQLKNYTVYGVIPHMHKLGRTLKVTSVQQGEESCVVDVDRWNFNWQNAWFYDEPLTWDATKGDPTITLTCGYDTSTRNEAIKWGDSTNDEMCVNGWYSTYDGL